MVQLRHAFNSWRAPRSGVFPRASTASAAVELTAAELAGIIVSLVVGSCAISVLATLALLRVRRRQQRKAKGNLTTKRRSRSPPVLPSSAQSRSSRSAPISFNLLRGSLPSPTFSGDVAAFCSPSPTPKLPIQGAMIKEIPPSPVSPPAFLFEAPDSAGLAAEELPPRRSSTPSPPNVATRDVALMSGGGHTRSRSLPISRFFTPLGRGALPRTGESTPGPEGLGLFISAAVDRQDTGGFEREQRREPSPIRLAVAKRNNQDGRRRVQLVRVPSQRDGKAPGMALNTPSEGTGADVQKALPPPPPVSRRLSSQGIMPRKAKGNRAPENLVLSQQDARETSFLLTGRDSSEESPPPPPPPPRSPPGTNPGAGLSIIIPPTPPLPGPDNQYLTHDTRHHRSTGTSTEPRSPISSVPPSPRSPFYALSPPPPVRRPLLSPSRRARSNRRHQQQSAPRGPLSSHPPNLTTASTATIPQPSPPSPLTPQRVPESSQNSLPNQSSPGLDPGPDDFEPFEPSPISRHSVSSSSYFSMPSAPALPLRPPPPLPSQLPSTPQARASRTTMITSESPFSTPLPSPPPILYAVNQGSPGEVTPTRARTFTLFPQVRTQSPRPQRPPTSGAGARSRSQSDGIGGSGAGGAAGGAAGDYFSAGS